MKRTLAAWLPNWPLVRLAIKQPELAVAPCALFAPSRRGQAITAVCPRAHAAGVRVDMPLAEATVLLEHAGNPHVGNSLRELHHVGNFLRKLPPTLGESRPRSPSFHLLPHDQAADRTALEKLAQWCHRFSPSVGWEMAPDPARGNAPDALLLDATNLGPLFGGEDAWAHAVACGLARLGLPVQVAVADSPGAALAAAKWGEERKHEIRSSKSETNSKVEGPKQEQPAHPTRFEFPHSDLFRVSDFEFRISHIPHGGNRAALGPLPLAALRLPTAVVETLQHLGFAVAGELLDLPREQLLSRLGPEALWRIDQALGRVDEPIHTVAPPPSAVVERLLEFPLADRELLAQVVDGLVEQLAWLLARRSEGALAVECRFECVGGPERAGEQGCSRLRDSRLREMTSARTPLKRGLFSREHPCSPGAPAILAQLYQPTASPRQMAEILAMHFERLALPAPVEALTLSAVRTARLGERQRSLFDGADRPRQSPQLAGLVNRLVGRLGQARVVRRRLVRDPQPECAFATAPLIEEARKLQGLTPPGSKKKLRQRSEESASSFASPATATLMPLERPWQLLAEPQGIETLAIAPDGPPKRFRWQGAEHDVTRHWGPERIETGWQRRGMIARDYYRVETTAGIRAWLFRRRADGRWFLHGWFD